MVEVAGVCVVGAEVVFTLCVRDGRRVLRCVVTGSALADVELPRDRHWSALKQELHRRLDVTPDNEAVRQAAFALTATQWGISLAALLQRTHPAFRE